MASNTFCKEAAAVNKLSETIKAKFEQDGVLREVQCLLQSKIIALMTEKNELQRSHCPSTEEDKGLNLLHKLIMEYLKWHGFHYTAEVFSVESARSNVTPVRYSLEEKSDSPIVRKDLPILLQLLATELEKQNSQFTQKNYNL